MFDCNLKQRAAGRSGRSMHAGTALCAALALTILSLAGCARTRPAEPGAAPAPSLAPARSRGEARVVAQSCDSNSSVTIPTSAAGYVRVNSEFIEVDPQGHRNDAALLPVIPQVRKAVVHDGTVAPDESWKIVYLTTGDSKDVEADKYAAEQLAAEFEESWGISVAVEGRDTAGGVTAEIAFLRSGMRIPVQGGTGAGNAPSGAYTITVAPDSSVRLVADTAAGRYYAVQTLRQLVRASGADGSRALPNCVIEDWPALEWRGLSDDISRGQVSTLEDFLSIIRRLGYYKKNLYQPYIEDMYAFKSGPEIGRERGAITPEEFAAMVEEGRRNHVTVVPVFESLGHQDRLLSLPEYRPLAELNAPDTTPWSFSPVSEESFKFVTQLIDELAAATPDAPFFHIGCDESWDVGQGTSKERVKEIGIGRVHGQYFARLINHIREKHNRATLLYGDMLLAHPKGLEEVPKDAWIVDWHYVPAKEGGYPSVKKLQDAGFQNILVSPGIFSWAQFYPVWARGFDNVADFAQVGKDRGARGCITSSWGDDGAENIRENNWPGYAWSAAAEWEPCKPDLERFLNRYPVVHHGANPEAAASLARVHRLLGWPAWLPQPYMARELHRSLRLRPQSDENRVGLEQLAADMDDVIARIDEVGASEGAVSFNGAALPLLRHAALRYRYLAHRQLAFDQAAHLIKAAANAEEKARIEREEILPKLEQLRGDLLAIIAEFPGLWLERSKYPMLNVNMERLYDQVAALQGMILAAQAGSLSTPATPTATWFWYPDPDPRKSTPEGTRYFARRFEVQGKVEQAEIRMWADDRATVFLNGRRVGAALYGQPAMVRRVTPMLSEHGNTLAIEGTNNYGAAGILFELTIRYADGHTQRITGDGEWRCVAEEPKERDWRNSPPPAEWVPVKLLGKGLIVPWTDIDW